MKLKTKFQDEDFELGEVVEANVYYGGDGRIKVIAEPAKGGMITFYFETLKGMNEMFEDAPEEPEEYWYIAELCGGLQRKQDTDNGEDRFNKQIGNYFETEEEAEKAVEKLKIYSKLKQKGFVFSGWYYSMEGQLVILADNHEFSETEPEDLTELFGDKIC